MCFAAAAISVLQLVSVQAQLASSIGGAKHAPLPTALRPICSTISAASSQPTADRKRTARALAAQAQQAAILGDVNGAIAALRSAIASDPTDPDLAYRLARVLESSASADSAVSEYCRYLALAPTGPDASDSRVRVAALARPTTDARVDSANVHFNRGLEAYERRDVSEADAEFTRALREQPAWGDAYYDRALARAARGDRSEAMSDLELYLRVTPNAVDRAAVVAWMSDARFRRYSSAGAFSLGVLLPGAGQFYTGRPGFAAVPLVSAATAIGIAVLPRTTTITATQEFIDIDGTHRNTTVQRRTDRPYLAAGLATAGAITLAAAIEASVYARRENAREQRVSLALVPSSRELSAVLSVQIGPWLR
jgi:tetratricopeptide (TPR) repeat protein